MVLARQYDLISKYTNSKSFRRKCNAITVLAIISYLIQFFNRVINSYIPYDFLILFAFTLFVTSSESIRLPKLYKYECCWIPFLIVVLYNVMIRNFTIGFAVDWFTYFICISFVMMRGKTIFVFKNVLKVVSVSSLIFAASIFFQLLVPAGYALYLNLLPSETVGNILRYKSTAGSLTGFSTNPGFAAGHLVSGIISCYATRAQNSVEKKIKIAKIVFLFAALLLTAKRSHLLMVIFVLLIVYLIVSDSSKRILAVNVLIVGSAIIIPCLLIFGEVLSTIPALGRVASTVSGLINGEDITNGRSKLYAFAYKLFRDNPVWGIGWGQFRERVVGKVTIETELDTHNIYLQLLCEVGIIGFLTAIIPMIVFLVKSINNLRNAAKSEMILNIEWMLAVYSLGYQLFFLLYGISGNPIYDYNYVIMYFISCAISVSLSEKREKVRLI